MDTGDAALAAVKAPGSLQAESSDLDASKEHFETRGVNERRETADCRVHACCAE